MQLGNGFPKLDLTQYDDLAQSKPLDNADLGLVRVCLGSLIWHQIMRGSSG